MKRKTFLAATVGAAFLPTLRHRAAPTGTSSGVTPGDTAPATWSMPDLTVSFRHPVKLRSVDLLRVEAQLFVVVTTAEGQKGIAQCNARMEHLTSLLKGLVVPHFAGQDARHLLTLADNAYRLNSNYKYAGMPLWNCIGSVELAVWDLLGKIAGKPVHALIGRQVRRDYPIYVSDFDRDRAPEAVADVLAAKLDATGATGVKIKLGGRMRNTPDDDRRTRALIPIVRRRLGAATTIYADANGSYTASEAIAIGRLLEEHNVAVLEEPCNFEDEDSTRRVNAALEGIVLAGGEQDTSPYRFRRLAETDVYDVLQPDLYYNGGLARALHVAAIAQRAGKQIAPHSPKADPLIGPFWQFAALAPNLFGLQEFVYGGGPGATWFTPRIAARDGRIPIPDTPGLGFAYDESIWPKAERIL